MKNNKLTVALYGIELHPEKRAEVMSRFMDFAAGVFNQYRLPMNHFCCSLIKEKAVLKQYKAFTFQRKGPFLYDELKNNNVHALCLFSIGKKSCVWDPDMNMSLKMEEGRCEFIFDIEMRHVKDKTVEPVLGLMKNTMQVLRDCLQYEYGVAYTMPRNFGSYGYAMGLACTCMTDALIYDTDLWSDKGNKRAGRRLRNVFAMNILSKGHKKITVNGSPLFKWIETHPKSELIECPEDKVYIWSLCKKSDHLDKLAWDSPAVEKVRKVFMKNRLFLWQKDLDEWNAL